MKHVNEQKKLTKWLLLSIGTISLGLGIVGIFLPLLPTTPFLLLATACYARSSEKFYNKLLDNKIFGEYIKNYRDSKGIPLKVKIVSISLLLLTITISIILITDTLLARFILILIAVAVTIHILSIRTFKK